MSASIAKFAAANRRAERSELKTKTGWSPRCHDSLTEMVGNHRERASVTCAASAADAEPADRSEPFRASVS